MKTFYILTLTLFSAFLNAQTVDVAGSSPTTGDIKEFFYDSTDDLLYGIGRVSNAGGQTVEGIVAWDGTDWTAKGDQSLLDGPLAGNYNPNSITRNGDTLYAMAADITHPEGYQMGFLMYWDETVSNWKNKTYGVFGNDYQLVSYSDTLFIVGNVSGGLDLSEAIADYNSLGDMAYWTGTRWEKYTSAPDFDQNTLRAVVIGGALYIGGYKYEAGVWTNSGLPNCINSLGKWGSKVVYSTYEGGTNYIKTYDGTTLSTIGISDAEITGITEYDSKLAVCGLGIDDIDGAIINKVGSFDGTTWSTLFPSYIQGTGAHRVAGYHNQLLVSAEDGVFYNTQSTPFSIGSIVLIAGPQALNQPTGLTITPTFKAVYDKMQLNWTDNSNNELGFIIERSLDSTLWSTIDSVALDITSYLDTGLTENTTYYYRVLAYNNTGVSAPSNIDSGFTGTITHITENLNGNENRIYPNPNGTGKLNIAFEGNYIANIYNINGQIVKATTNLNNLSIIDISEINRGIYFVQIINEEGNFTQKLIIE